MKQSQHSGRVLIVIVVMMVLVSLGVIHAVTQLKIAPTSLSPLVHSSGTTVNGTPTMTMASLLSPLSVSHTQIVNAKGQVITLVGATRDSLEYLCNGDGHFSRADFQNMHAWGMNVVRIPLSSEFWAVCTGYHINVVSAVANAEAAGLYVILDLQWDAPFDTVQDRQLGGTQCPLPDNKQDVRFWQDLASIYHNDQSVLFDLYSEPHDVSWESWLHGGTIQSGCYQISKSSTLEKGAYTAIGMQALANDVRAIAPTNILIISGVDWGYDLSGIMEGYTIQGSNIMYGTHPFNYGDKQPNKWVSGFGNAAKKVAVIATEFGSYDCGTAYNAAAITYFDVLHISWLAWSWNVAGCGGPSLLSAWPATPSVPYGSYIQAQLLAVARQRA